MSLCTRLAAAALLTLLSVSAAVAEPFALATAFDGVYRVDLATREASLVGEMGLYGTQYIAVEGLTYAPDGKVYGVSDNIKALFRIDPLVAGASFIGSIGLAGQGQPPLDNLDTSLAATADGRFWLASAYTGQLWRVDPATGATSLVGATGVKVSSLAARGNVLYAAGSRGDEALYTIDTTTARATRIASFRNVTGYAASVSLAFDRDGTLYAVVNYNPPEHDSDPLTQWSDLARIDTTTWQMTRLGTITGPNELRTLAIRGFTIAPPVAGGIAVTEIPAASSRLLALLASLIAGVALVSLRRRPAR
jgi:hypothetical protein